MLVSDTSGDLWAAITAADITRGELPRGKFTVKTYQRYLRCLKVCDSYKVMKHLQTLILVQRRLMSTVGQGIC